MSGPADWFEIEPGAHGREQGRCGTRDGRRHGQSGRGDRWDGAAQNPGPGARCGPANAARAVRSTARPCRDRRPCGARETPCPAVFAMEELAGTLASLSDSRDWTTHSRPKHPHAIPIARVLSEAWSVGLLERSSEQLVDGEKAPPIPVVRYRLRGRSWYGVSDGNHRTEAARRAGRTHMRADRLDVRDHPRRVRCAPRVRGRTTVPARSRRWDSLSARFGDERHNGPQRSNA
jgi:uncharacterized ParB-like nuclease family protein